MVGEEKPQGGEVPRRGRNQNPADAELFGDERGVHRTRPSVGQEGELSRVQPLPDSNGLDGADHAGDGDLDDPVGGADFIEAGKLAADPQNGFPRETRVEPHPAGGERIGTQAVQDHVGIGHSGFEASPPVAGRTGVGARALGSHGENAPSIHPGDAPPSRTDRLDLHLEKLVGVAQGLALRRHGRHSVREKADVGAGPSHIVGDDPALSRRPRQMAGRRHAPGRTRKKKVDGETGRLFGGHHASAGGDDVEPSLKSSFFEPLVQPPQVAAHGGSQIGVQDRRREALILPEFRDDLGGGGHEDPRQERFKEGLCPHLVLPVEVGMQKAYGYCLDPFLHELPGEGRHLRPRHRPGDPPARQCALIHLQAEGPGDERGRFPVFELVEDHPVAEAELQDVSKALGRHDGRPGALLFENGIRGDGRPVHEAGDGRKRGVGLLEALQDSAGEVLADGGCLHGAKPAGRVVVNDNVGERPADVHTDP